MKKKLLLLFVSAVLACPSSLHAVPAYPAKRVVTLPDGSRQTLTLTGDEHCHYWLSETGRPMQVQADGQWRELSAFEVANMRTEGGERRGQSNARRARRRAIGHFTPLFGKKKGLVILVNFMDNTFSVESPRETFNNYFNQRDYTEYGMTGSVSDYFRMQSYGNFELDFDVVGPYTMSKPMAAYGAPNGSSHDTDPRSMVSEACLAANPEVNFADYDWDSDGEVDQVFIIYAGYGENYGADANCIWPHEWVLSSELKLDGRSIRTYGCTCELSGTSGQNLDGIGAACHEFSHCLGYPDFYDTQGNNFAMSYWDLMSAGSYNNGSRTPAGYTAYERWMAGWLTPVELKGAERTVTDMPALVDEPVAYVIYNEAAPNEYYLLENRQLRGFDAGLYGHGLLVVHVDYNEDAWSSNSVNTSSSHQRMTVIPADNSYSNLAGDPFPGSRGVTALTDLTTPAATLYNNNADGRPFMGKAIERIAEDANGLMSFLALRGPLGTPSPRVASVGGTTFTAIWPAISGATAYDLQLIETPSKLDPSDALRLEEDFQGCYSKSAGFSDVGSKLNSLLKTSGFAGEKLYTSPDLLRFGTNTVNGYLRTPTQRALSTGELTIVLKLKPFADGTEVKCDIQVVTNGKGTETLSIAFSHEQYIVLHPTTVLDEIFQVRILPSSRMYISYLALYDGSFSEEELGLTAQVKENGPRRVNTTTYSADTNSYTFEGLNPTSAYALTVRAKDSERFSEWSETINVTLDPSGVAAPSAISSGADGVVYDMAGRRVKDFTQPGIYIRNGKKFLRK